MSHITIHKIEIEKSKSLLSISKEYCAKGLSVIPTNLDKSTATRWKKFQTSIPTDRQLHEMFEDHHIGIGIIAGKVSGNLEVIDIDLKNDITGKLYELLCLNFTKENSELFDKLNKVKTKNAGFHWYYRCSEIESRKILAMRDATECEKGCGDTSKVLIETRGEGTYVIAPPSNGYCLLKIEEFNIPLITPQERNYILSLCMSFTEIIEEVYIPTIVKKDSTNYSITPWEDYNNRGLEDMMELLQRKGWTIVKQNIDKIIFKRPGITDSFSSGNYSHKLNFFSVFTTSSSDFEPQKGYRPSAVFTILECGGDWGLGNKKLLERGYGKKNPSSHYDIEDTPSVFQIFRNQFIEESIYKNSITRFCEIDGKEISESAMNSRFISIAEKNKKMKGLTKSNFEIFVNSEEIIAKNPIKDFLESLPPTNSRTAISSLADSIQLIEHKHFNKFAVGMFRSRPTYGFVKRLIIKWLIGVVAGVYDGNYNSLMIVLIGPKSTGKTEFFRRLLPNPLKTFFAQSKLKEGKDSEALMCEKILILNDELDGMNRTDASSFRSFISHDKYTYRPPYGSRNTTFKRLASVCGTSNEREIIIDSVNNRRIIPIEIKGVDFDKYNSVDKVLLFAEVYSLYKSGEKWELTINDLKHLDEFMKGYEQESIERDIIHQLYIPGDKDNEESNTLTVAEIMKEMNEFSSHAKLNNIKVGRELKSLGFIQRQTRRGITVVRTYECIRIKRLKDEN